MDFEHTAVAIRTFDREVGAAWDCLSTLSNNELTSGHVYRVANLERRLGKAVGHAYWLDTKDSNSRTTCEACVRPDPWLRSKVALWEASLEASQRAGSAPKQVIP